MSLKQILLKSIKDFYENLFLLSGVSLIWFFIVGALLYVGIAGVFLRLPLPILMNLIFVGPLTLGAFHFTSEVIQKKEIKLRDYFRQFARQFLRGIFAYWLSLAIMIILGVDLIFFLNAGSRFWNYLSGIWIYLILFFMMSQFYFWSLLVQLKEGIFKTLKRSLLLTLDNIVFSLGIFLIFSVLVLIGAVTVGIGLALTFIGFLGLLANNSTYNLLVKYGIKEEDFGPYNNN